MPTFRTGISQSQWADEIGQTAKFSKEDWQCQVSAWKAEAASHTDEAMAGGSIQAKQGLKPHDVVQFYWDGDCYNVVSVVHPLVVGSSEYKEWRCKYCEDGCARCHDGFEQGEDRFVRVVGDHPYLCVERYYLPEDESDEDDD